MATSGQTNSTPKVKKFVDSASPAGPTVILAAKPALLDVATTLPAMTWRPVAAPHAAPDDRHFGDKLNVQADDVVADVLEIGAADKG